MPDVQTALVTGASGPVAGAFARRLSAGRLLVRATVRTPAEMTWLAATQPAAAGQTFELAAAATRVPATVAGVALLGERLTGGAVIGAIVILTGAAMSQGSRRPIRPVPGSASVGSRGGQRSG